MSLFYPCLTWVPQGTASSHPKSVLSLEYIQQQLQIAESARLAAENDNVGDSEEARINEEYGLDDYDNDVDTTNANSGMDVVLNDQDNDSESEEEDEDFELQPSDNLIVYGKVQQTEGASSAEVHVYNEPNKQFYSHHEFYLTSFPLCMEWFSTKPKESNVCANFLAVGLMEPAVELWDLDVVDSLEPQYLLGSKKNTQKSKKKGSVATSNSHTDAVLDIAWNQNSSHILATASADQSVGIWDLNTCELATQLKHHKDKVQALNWHPVELQTLLSGSYDKSACLLDCRQASSSPLSWSLAGEVERVKWDPRNPYQFFATTDSGFLHQCDARKAPSPLYSIAAHEGSCAGLVITNNLILTGGGDGLLKIWRRDQNGAVIELASRDWSVGEVTSLKVNPNCEFVFAFTGSQDYKVWDIREDARVRAFLGTQGVHIAELDDA